MSCIESGMIQQKNTGGEIAEVLFGYPGVRFHSDEGI